jgi:hypothetical protein
MIGKVTAIRLWKTGDGFFFDLQDAKGDSFNFVCFTPPKFKVGDSIDFQEDGWNKDNTAIIAKNITVMSPMGALLTKTAGDVFSQVKGHTPAKETSTQTKETSQVLPLEGKPSITRLESMKVAGALVAAKIQAGIGIDASPVEQVKAYTRELERFIKEVEQ